MTNNSKLKIHDSGFSLIEIIIYISLLAIFIGAITWSFSVIFHSYNRMKNERAVENSAMVSMDRIVREIRNSKSVDLVNTATSTPNGYLTLNNFDSYQNPGTVRFYLLDNRIYEDKNGTTLGPLTSEDTDVSSLVFRYFTSASSTGIKIEMAIGIEMNDEFFNKACKELKKE